MKTTALPAISESAYSNLQAYQRLQLTLILGLRRQIAIAVCDNLELRDRLAVQLERDINPSSRLPQLVTIDLDLNNPTFLKQIDRWLKQNPDAQNAPCTPTFQIIGIEGLTRQPSEVQCRFIKHLSAISRHLPQLNVNLLLWLPRPWYHNIKQTVPEFWQWRTGVFEFPGESNAASVSLQSAVDVLKKSLDASAHPVELNGHSSPQPEADILMEDSDRGRRLRSAHASGEFPFVRHLSFPGYPPSQKTPPSASKIVQKAAKTEEMTKPPVAANFIAPVAVKSQLSVLPSLPSLADLDRLEIENNSPEVLVQTFIEIGDRYRDRIANGETQLTTLSTAIAAYERGLQWLEDDLPTLSNIFNDLGNFYWMRSRSKDRELAHTLDDLEQAIQYYHLALEKLGNPDNAAQHYAMIQNNLGAAFGDLARYGEPADRLQLSIQAYTEALRYRNASVDPLKYGSTQNNLGTAYWHLAQYLDPVSHLKAAIAAYEEAVAQYSPQTASMQWAMIHNNLGTAYWNLAQHENSERWLQEAVQCYNFSLEYRTRENAPAACAATYNNLGTAFWHLGSKEVFNASQRQNYLAEAIAAYEVAIEIGSQLSQQQPPIPVNFDLPAADNNLGLVCFQLATTQDFDLDHTDQAQYLEIALKAHIRAIQIITSNGDAYETTLKYIARILRWFYQEGGIPGQNRALSLVPGQLLPALLPRL
ncbi:MAG: tetratricopeptide repeat protein [Jaaginema sp. PMC 1079.18]|nr:tetratricopeptide repeat protein [Jaaginema sp. PMC 1080.18]MEC4852809.1 tetratricopeptide repeat protein [Jaaginema sp. PMC 1079.18]MEC4867057.1 tetratricopeptide repeat protein [Jaaginema sp. PMC 1078.18]